MADQLAGQVIQKLRILRRVGGPQVVGLVHDTPAQQPEPDAVDDVAGEPRILRGGEPVGKPYPGSCPGSSSTVSPPGNLGLMSSRARVAERLLRVDVDDLFLPLHGGFVLHLREEGRQPLVVVRGPVFRGMTVAAGAADAGAHEGEGRNLGHVQRVLFEERRGRNWPAVRGSCCRWPSTARGRTGRRACYWRCSSAPSGGKPAPRWATACWETRSSCGTGRSTSWPSSRRTPRRPRSLSISRPRFCESWSAR